MGDFASYNMTYHIEVADLAMYNKIQSSLSRLGLSYKNSSTEKASVCILEAGMYFSNKVYYDNNYEICLKILSKEEIYELIKEIN